MPRFLFIIKIYFKVCRKFAKLAKKELVTRQKDEEDWRLKFIERKKFGKRISSLTAGKLLEKAKRKDSAFTERLILTTKHRDSEHYDIQMTEVCLTLLQRDRIVTFYV